MNKVPLIDEDEVYTKLGCDVEEAFETLISPLLNELFLKHPTYHVELIAKSLIDRLAVSSRCRQICTSRNTEIKPIQVKNEDL
jgi:hypothetical protein